MQDYAIQKSSRKCHSSNRPLAPGERYISSIVQSGKELIRRDFALDRWSGPSEQTVGWWKTSVPQKKSSGPSIAPPIVLVDTLVALLETPGKEELAFVLALLLVRRRVLVENTKLDDEDQASNLEQLDLRFPADDRNVLIPVLNIASDRASELQQQLSSLLYTEE